MKREKRTTKKERKAAQPAARAAQLRQRAAAPSAGHQHEHAHIHCIACGKHLDPDDFGEAHGATFYRCQHGSDFPHCTGCAERAKQMVDEHDRTGRPVQKAAAVH
jgi:NAD-dependent SIR2 family protein deacetylase